jgi:hypothetical protein
MSKHILYEADETGILHDTGKTIDLKDKNNNDIVKSIFELYGFNQYEAYFRVSECGGKINIKYSFHDGDHIVWALAPAKD